MKGIVTLYNSDKITIKRVSINKLTYKQNKIIEKSIEKFFDDDPCIIHSTYCINMLAMELLDEINKDYDNCERLFFKIQECPNSILELINFDKNVSFVEII